MFGIGMTELMVVFVVGLVVLGPKRLPSLARSLGRTLAEFRHASNELRRDFMDVANQMDPREDKRSDAITPTEGPPAALEPATTEPSEAPSAKDLRKDESSGPSGE